MGLFRQTANQVKSFNANHLPQIPHKSKPINHLCQPPYLDLV